MPESMTFTDKSKREIHVIYESDGTPLFCSKDIATAAGYKAPSKAVSQNRRKIEAVKCYVDWQNETKRGKVQTYFFAAENALKFMNKKPVMNDDCKWIINTVIPQAQEIGCRMAAEKLRSEKPIAEPQKEPTAPLSRESIAERLDNIILECLLMKKELIQTK
jgi:prophage antirepressor-like protein